MRFWQQLLNFSCLFNVTHMGQFTIQGFFYVFNIFVRQLKLMWNKSQEVINIHLSLN